MPLFDFHHHHQNTFGIYNKPLLTSDYEDFFSVGIHPKDINEDWQYTFENVKIQSKNPKCLTLGECGLDGLINVDLKIQKEVFLKHIEWANYIKKPITIHCVKRFSELIQFVKLAHVPLIIHGFNKKRTVFDEMVKHGFYLSFGKALLHNVSLQNTFYDCPLERFFLESDDSDVDIQLIYQKAAEIKGLSLEVIEYQIRKNLDNITKL